MHGHMPCCSPLSWWSWEWPGPGHPQGATLPQDASKFCILTWENKLSLSILLTVQPPMCILLGAPPVEAGHPPEQTAFSSFKGTGPFIGTSVFKNTYFHLEMLSEKI